MCSQHQISESFVKKEKEERMRNYLKYEDFICFIQAKMQERMGEEVQIQIQQVVKNNNIVLDGLCIAEKDSSIAPTIYLNGYYRQYEEGRTVPEILDAMQETYEKNRKEINFDPSFYADFTCVQPHLMCRVINRQKNEERLKQDAMQETYEKNRKEINFDPSFYADFTCVQPHLMCRVINRQKNEERLKQVPWRPFLNLAIVVCCYFEDEVIGNGSILVYQNHLNGWGITEEELFRVARENTLRIQPEEFMSMNTILKKYHAEFGENSEPQPIFVLTNRGNYFGAVCMIFDSVLSEIGETLQDDFWVLPSSIHECVIVPAQIQTNGTELQALVREINRKEVQAEEFLSNEIYFYHRMLHKLIMK